MLPGTVARRTFSGSDGQPASCSGRASADSGVSSLSPELHGVDLGHDLLLQPLQVVERLRDRHVLERRPEKRHRQPDRWSRVCNMLFFVITDQETDQTPKGKASNLLAGTARRSPTPSDRARTPG